MIRPKVAGSARSRSPTIAEQRQVVLDDDLGERLELARDRLEPARVSSTVTDTLTSEVVTTSTDVWWRSNTSNSRRRKPCASSIPVDVTSITVTWRLQAKAVTGASCRPGSAVIRVPARAGPPRVEDPHRDVARERRLDRLRMQHLGAEVGQLRRLGEREVRHEPRLRRTTRGSAVSMPSTSVQIWISSTPSAAPMIAAE